MSGIKLHYFDLRGRGEMCRMVLEAAGVQYEDVRVSLKDWAALKPKTKYGVLPELEYQGRTYHQSQAIAVFLAREHNLCGEGNLDLLKTLEVTGMAEDLGQVMDKEKWYSFDATQAYPLTPSMTQHLARFQNLLTENGDKGFFIGSAVTLGDIYVHDITETILKAHPKALDDFPAVVKMRRNVEAHPRLKAYLATRKDFAL